MPTPFKSIPLEPLSGQLDLRSAPGAANLTDYRLVLNMSMNDRPTARFFVVWSPVGWRG